MSLKSEVVSIAPAPATMLLELAGRSPAHRRHFLRQRMLGQSIGYQLADGTVLAAAMLCQMAGHRRRWQLALAIAPAAATHMLALCRAAHLTLGRITHTGVLVYCHVSPGNRAGARMARLVGFRAGRMADPSIWIWRGHDQSFQG